MRNFDFRLVHIPQNCIRTFPSIFVQSLAMNCHTSGWSVIVFFRLVTVDKPWHPMTSDFLGPCQCCLAMSCPVPCCRETVVWKMVSGGYSVVSDDCLCLVGFWSTTMAPQEFAAGPRSSDNGWKKFVAELSQNKTGITAGESNQHWRGYQLTPDDTISGYPKRRWKIAVNP